MQKIMMSPKAFAAASGIGESQVYRLCHVKDFPVARAGRRLLIHAEAAAEWLAQAAREGRDLAAAK